MPKTIVIVGATGNQGSSVANTFLSLSNWHVRAITRNPSSPSALALASRGATIITADLSSPSSLATAFRDAHAIFLNTDFWGPYRDSKSSVDAFNEELQQGKNAAVAASNIPTLERFVYSALGPIKRHSRGKYSHSYHWDSKASIVEYIENEQGGLAGKTSFVYAGVYASNPLFMPRWDGGEGMWKFVLPMEGETKIPVFAPDESMGAFVRALVEDEEAGVKLLAYDSYLAVGEVVEAWSRATGRKAELVTVSMEYMHETLGVPWEVLEAPRFIEEFGYMGGVEGAIGPGELKGRVETRSFEEWLRARDWEELLAEGEGELESVKD